MATLALILMLPLAEMVARRLFTTSISGVHSFTQHFTLVAGMLGGAVAARRSQLLALATGDLLAKSRFGPVARGYTAMVGVAITIYLTLAGLRFVAVEREAATTIAYGVSAWVLELSIPIGFGLVAWRIVRGASDTWRGRIIVLASSLAIAWLADAIPAESGLFVPLGLAVVLSATVLGAPIYTVLGGIALVLFRAAEVPIAAVTVEHYQLSTNATLPALPLFTLAGYVMAESGASRRLIRLFQALVGHIRGGPGLLTAIACAFFTSFTGASGVTILALGGLLMPVLIAANYSERTALGLLTGTGSLGLLLPPCLPLILYAIIAQVDIVDMFLGGVIPGILIVAMVGAWAIAKAPKRTGPRPVFRWREARDAVSDAKWELLIPVVALGGMFSGLATAVEAAALTAFYALFVEVAIHRDLRIGKDLTRVFAECGALVGGLLLVLGVALGFTNYLVDAEVPTKAVEWVTASIESPWMFLLLLNGFLIVVGALMDIYSALVIVVPLIVPMGVAFGIDPVHLGIVFLANAELGYLMPPMGENVFIAALRFEKPLAEVFRSVIPMVIVFAVAVLLITYIPALTTTLPALVGGP